MLTAVWLVFVGAMVWAGYLIVTGDKDSRKFLNNRKQI